MLLLILFLTFCNGDIIYKLESTKTCSSAMSGSSITDKAICQTQAQQLGMTDITANTIAMSAVFPGGCIYKDNELYIFDSQNTNQCSETYQCICKYEAPICSQGTNEKDCICGDEICTNDNGLICSGSTCSHPQDCTINTANSQICKCGMTDCTKHTGLFCKGTSCIHTPQCQHTKGLLSNNAICMCGSVDCVSEYCVAASSTCHAPCSAGQYISDSFVCENCDVTGYYCPAGATQSATSFSCPTGTYSETTRISSELECKKCTKGRYSDKMAVSNSNECNVCTSNMYQDEEGMSKCKGCPDEKIIVDTITGSKHDSIDDCVINIPTCSSTQYLKNNICTHCIEGNICDGTIISICPPGHYCTGDGTKIPCPSGKYGESLGSTTPDTCIECDIGTFQTISGQTYCDRSCPIGSYGIKKGANTLENACVSCPMGNMCPTMGMKQPTKCPMGTFQNTISSYECSQCPKNTFSDIFESITCTKCGINLQTNGIGSTSNSQCLEIEQKCPGAQRPVKKICTDCNPGFYSNGEGTECILCPIGYSQSEYKQNSCNVCEECHMLGTATKSNSFDLVSNITKYDETPVKIQYELVNVIVYITLSTLVIIIVCIHRCCPYNLKNLDLFFSGEHPIEDTHARRVLETRLGAALSLSIPLIIAGISVFVFTDDNTSVTSSLVPVGTVDIDSDFNYLYFQYRSFYANEVDTCQDISIDTVLECESTVETFKNNCFVNITCFLQKEISGNNFIELEIPDNQQWAILTSYPSMWMYSQKKINTVIKPETPLQGTTVMTFGITRSIYTDVTTKTSKYGINMNFRDIEYGQNDDHNGIHYLSLKLSTSESIFSFISDVKLNFITQLSTVLTLLISVMSSMKTIKLLLEKIIDGCYTQCCGKIPKDIQRRKEILYEENKNKTTVEKKVNAIHTDEHGQKYYYNHETKKSEWVL